MRSDMAKVVTEAPRRKSWRFSKSLKTGLRLRSDDELIGPLRHPISRNRQFGDNAKSFSDLTGPLVRFLRKQVGRPWNDVYSEMSKILDSRSLTGRHIWTHVFQEVELHPTLKYDRLFYQVRFGEYIPLEGLYVHPTNGLLLWSAYRRPKYRSTPDPNLTKLDDFHELARLEGIWYLNTYYIHHEKRVHYSTCTTCASMDPRPLYTYSARDHERYVNHAWTGTIKTEIINKRKLLSKHQLSRKELLRYAKTNSVLSTSGPSRRERRRLNLS